MTAPRSEYLQSPVLTQTMPSGPRSVRGITVLSGEVFLVRGRSANVEAYELEALTPRRSFIVDELVDPSDVASCPKFDCLYVSDWIGSVVHRVELNGNATCWLTDDVPNGISVTNNTGNVIVTCNETRKLKEYTTHGNMLREVRLQEDLIRPWHAVQSSDGKFIVCHGWTSDEWNRVCVIGADGRMTRRHYGRHPGPAGNGLVRLSVDMQDNILVADFNNARVLLLSPLLTDVRELVSQRDVSGEFKPGRLCLDESCGRLFVADSCQKNVLVFQVQNV